MSYEAPPCLWELWRRLLMITTLLCLHQLALSIMSASYHLSTKTCLNLAVLSCWITRSVICLKQVCFCDHVFHDIIIMILILFYSTFHTWCNLQADNILEMQNHRKINSCLICRALFNQTVFQSLIMIKLLECHVNWNSSFKNIQ